MAPIKNRREISGGKVRIGGPDQVRTDDLLNAIEALFQLRYEPVTNVRAAKNRERLANASGFLENIQNNDEAARGDTFKNFPAKFRERVVRMEVRRTLGSLTHHPDRFYAGTSFN